MPRILVYEFCTAIGLGRDPGDPAHSLFREGLAMRDAVAADFARIPGWEATTDPTASADRVLVIAPETDGVLEAKLAEFPASVHLGCTPTAVRLTTDKLALAEHWETHGIRTPRTRLFPEIPGEFPLVCKPRDGCGSTATMRVETRDDLENCREIAKSEDFPGDLILQPHIPGRPASVAFLVGPTGTDPAPLLPTFQLLSPDGRFHYRGGELPIRPDLAQRVIALARRAIDSVPGLHGFVGVDVILGEAADGTADFAIEINPRLTTSYVGLRELADFNLAEAMVAVASGCSVVPRWKPGKVRFYPDGRVERFPGSGEFFE